MWKELCLSGPKLLGNFSFPFCLFCEKRLIFSKSRGIKIPLSLVKVNIDDEERMKYKESAERKQAAAEQDLEDFFQF